MFKIINGGVCAAQGFKANGIHCGIRKNRTKKDLSLIYSEKKAAAAAVYTTNLVKGAPLTVTKKDFFTYAILRLGAKSNITVLQKSPETGHIFYGKEKRR